MRSEHQKGGGGCHGKPIRVHPIDSDLRPVLSTKSIDEIQRVYSLGVNVNTLHTNTVAVFSNASMRDLRTNICMLKGIQERLGGMLNTIVNNLASTKEKAINQKLQEHLEFIRTLVEDKLVYWEANLRRIDGRPKPEANIEGLPPQAFRKIVHELAVIAPESVHALKTVSKGLHQQMRQTVYPTIIEADEPGKGSKTFISNIKETVFKHAGYFLSTLLKDLIHKTDWLCLDIPLCIQVSQQTFQQTLVFPFVLMIINENDGSRQTGIFSWRYTIAYGNTPMSMIYGLTTAGQFELREPCSESISILNKLNDDKHGKYDSDQWYYPAVEWIAQRVESILNDSLASEPKYVVPTPYNIWKRFITDENISRRLPRPPFDESNVLENLGHLEHLEQVKRYIETLEKDEPEHELLPQVKETYMRMCIANAYQNIRVQFFVSMFDWDTPNQADFPVRYKGIIKEINDVADREIIETVKTTLQELELRIPFVPNQDVQNSYARRNAELEKNEDLLSKLIFNMEKLLNRVDWAVGIREQEQGRSKGTDPRHLVGTVEQTTKQSAGNPHRAPRRLLKCVPLVRAPRTAKKLR